MEVVEDAVLESRRSLCKQVMEESLLDRCWEADQRGEGWRDEKNGESGVKLERC